MKVKYLHSNTEVIGELIVRRGVATFIPSDATDEGRLTIERAEITICSEEDKSCVWIVGLKRESPGFWREVEATYYPVSQ